MSYCALESDCVVFDARLKVAGVCIGPTICEGCHSRSVGVLRMLRLDYVDLTQMLPKIDRRQEVSIFRPKPESSPPMNMQVFTLREDIANAVALAVRGVRERFDPLTVFFGEQMREGVALDCGLRYLEERLSLLAGLGVVQGCWDLSSGLSVALSGPQVLAEFSRLHHRARSVLGFADVTVSLPGRCPHCAVPALRRKADDAARIWCQACKATLDTAGYTKVISACIGP